MLLQIINRPLSDALGILIEKVPNMTFVVYGDYLYGNFEILELPGSAKCMFVTEDTHDTLGPNNLTLSEDDVFAALSPEEYGNIYFIQPDLHTAKVWQMKCLSWLEQAGVRHNIIRVQFDDDFNICTMNEVPVLGAQKSCSQWLRSKEKTDLSPYLIPDEARDFYINATSSCGDFAEFVLQLASQNAEFSEAYSKCYYRFPHHGLCDDLFFLLSYRILQSEKNTESVLKNWIKSFKKIHGSDYVDRLLRRPSQSNKVLCRNGVYFFSVAEEDTKVYYRLVENSNVR